MSIPIIRGSGKPHKSQIICKLARLDQRRQKKLVKKLDRSEKDALYQCLDESKDGELSTKVLKRLIIKINEAGKAVPSLTTRKNYPSRYVIGYNSTLDKIAELLDRNLNIVTVRRIYNVMRKNIIFEDLGGKKTVTPMQLSELIDNAKKQKKSTKENPLDLSAELEKQGFSPTIYGHRFMWSVLKNIDITGLKFYDCTFYNANFEDAELKDLHFEGCQFTHVAFSGSKIQGCTFHACNMSNSVLSGAAIEKVEFSDSDLVSCSFEDANISDCQFNKVTMPGTHFLDATVNNSDITCSNLQDVVFFDALESFTVDEISKSSWKITKLVSAILVTLRAIGISAPKIYMQLDEVAEVIPIRISVYSRCCEKEEMNEEADTALKKIENEGDKDQSIAKQLLEGFYLQPDLYPAANTILEKVDRLSKEVDSFVLPGGEDVPSRLYGEKPGEKTDRVKDYRRSILECAILEKSLSKGIPIMAICRGFQMANVFMGANLKQHVKGHHNLQRLRLKSSKHSGLLGQVLKRSIFSASFHHQAVEAKNIPDEFEATVLYDGLVKAAESKSPGASPMILLQFHPEFLGKAPVGLDLMTRVKYWFLSCLMSSKNDDIFKLLASSSKSYHSKKKLQAAFNDAEKNEEVKSWSIEDIEKKRAEVFVKFKEENKEYKEVILRSLLNSPELIETYLRHREGSSEYEYPEERAVIVSALQHDQKYIMNLKHIGAWNPLIDRLKNVDGPLYEKITSRTLQKKSPLTKKIIYPLEALKTVGSALYYAFQILISKIQTLVSRIVKKRHISTNALMSTPSKIDPSRFHWALNGAILNDAAKYTNDPEVLKEIEFLKRTYLHKIAPIHTKGMEIFDEKSARQFNLGAKQKHLYYRCYFGDENIRTAAEFNKNLGLGTKSPFIITDTIEFDHLLPASFSVLNDKTNNWEDKIHANLEDQYERCGSKFPKMLRNTFKKRFVFDLTNELNKVVITDGIEDKERRFKEAFVKQEQLIDRKIERAIESFSKGHPELIKSAKDRARLKKQIQKNSVCITRVKMNENVSGVKLLPAFAAKKHGDILKNASFFSLFMERSGLYIGAINKLRFLNSTSETGTGYQYEIEGSNNKRIPFYKEKDALTKLRSFQQLEEKMKSEEWSSKPHIKVLGESTLALLRGVFNDIKQERWSELIEDPVTGWILDASLYKIANHIANANMWVDNFNVFSKEMELIHAELSAILELTSPYTEKDFEESYSETLHDIVPEELKEHLRVGLGKTGGNLFTGIHTASFENNEKPVAVYGEGFYFEQKRLMGSENQFSKIMKDESIKSVDLYVGEFNPNVSVWKGATRYNRRDIGKDIREIFEKKVDTKHLTVGIDGTIDYAKSDEMKALLTEFAQEIKEGKLNVVFFKSGQKFDIMGMDNYYGAPFYAINNGDKQWKPYNKLFDAPVHKTDALSLQWFTLSNRYASELIDTYRKLVFENTRKILEGIPKSLRSVTGKPGKQLRINTADDKMLVTFLDIKIPGKSGIIKAFLILGAFVRFFAKRGIKVQDRHSFGFFHSNINIIYSKGDSYATIRINPGINPKENEAMIEFLSSLEKRGLSA